MEYAEALDYIIQATQKGNKKGFDAVSQVLSMLGSPQKRLKIVHVAGTNGKGSTVALLSQVFMERGLKVGVFTSPHLWKYNERIGINGVCISDAELAKELTLLKELTELLLGPGQRFSFFELLTMMAFHYFDENKVDIAVIEVGLGGRMDCTNLIEKPLLSVITAIGFDHMNILGKSIEQIAYEKAGIIKEQTPAVLFTCEGTVYDTVKGIADEKNAPLFYCNDFQVELHKQNLDETIFSVSFPIKDQICRYENIKISLLGDYQIYNAIHALFALEVFYNYCKQEALTGSDCIRVAEAAENENDNDNKSKEAFREAVYKGFAKAGWPGRMELVSREPLILLDGAHNVDGALALKRAVKTYFSTKKVITVIGILRDKEFEKMLEILRGDITILTEPHSSRSASVWDLSQVQLNTPVYQEPSYKEALSLALRTADEDPENSLVLVCGSLYLVGSIRSLLIGKNY